MMPLQHFLQGSLADALSYADLLFDGKQQPIETVYPQGQRAADMFHRIFAACESRYRLPVFPCRTLVLLAPQTLYIWKS